MRRITQLTVCVFLLTLEAQSQVRVGTPTDEAAIYRIRGAHDSAWNQHDAKGVAALFALDADRATVNGWFAGRDEIERDYSKTFGGAFQNATLRNESPKLRFLTADVALLDVDNVVTGAADSTPVKNHSTSIFVKRNGQWELVANRLIRMP
jgi:uncharacterized protein (TIGR02246 family)